MRKIKNKVVLLVIPSVILISFFVFYSFFLKEQYGIKDIPESFYEIKIQQIQDSTRLFDNSKFLFKTFLQSYQVKNFKLEKFKKANQNYFILDFAFRNQDKYKLLISKDLPTYYVKGKIIANLNTRKSAVILWTDQYNIFYNKEHKQYYNYSDYFDDRYFPWEIGKLTFNVFSNLDSNMIRKLYPDYSGKITDIMLDSIIVNWNKFDSLDQMVEDISFVKLINLKRR